MLTLIVLITLLNIFKYYRNKNLKLNPYKILVSQVKNTPPISNKKTYWFATNFKNISLKVNWIKTIINKQNFLNNFIVNKCYVIFWKITLPTLYSRKNKWSDKNVLIGIRHFNHR